MQPRPRQLVTVSVIAIVLGGVGVILAVTGLGQWSSGNFTGGLVPTYADDEFTKMHQRMASDVAAAMAPWRMIQIPMLIILLLTSAVLIYAGFQALGVRKIGRKVLLILFWFLIPFDMVRSIVNTAIGHKMSDIMISHMLKFAGTGRPQAPPNLDTWISGMSQVGIYLGLAFGVFWSLAKITFYVLAIRYFRRMDIVRLFNKTLIPVPPPLPPANKTWET